MSHPHDLDNDLGSLSGAEELVCDSLAEYDSRVGARSFTRRSSSGADSHALDIDDMLVDIAVSNLHSPADVSAKISKARNLLLALEHRQEELGRAHGSQGQVSKESLDDRQTPRDATPFNNNGRNGDSGTPAMSASASNPRSEGLGGTGLETAEEKVGASSQVEIEYFQPESETPSHSTNRPRRRTTAQRQSGGMRELNDVVAESSTRSVMHAWHSREQIASAHATTTSCIVPASDTALDGDSLSEGGSRNGSGREEFRKALKHPAFIRFKNTRKSFRTMKDGGEVSTMANI